MRRDAFLKLTGLTVGNHKALVRRDLLPVCEDPERLDGWGDYTLSQAIRTALSLELAHAGLTQHDASVATVDTDFAPGLFKAALDESLPDLWVGAFKFTYRSGRVLVDRIGVVVGGLHALQKCKVGKFGTVEELEKRSSAFVLVNLSRLMRTIKARSEDTGVAINFEGLWDPRIPIEPVDDSEA